MTAIYDTEPVQSLLRQALAEDLGGQDDVTVSSLVPADAQLHARLVAKEDGVVCGLPVFAKVCDAIAPATVEVESCAADGTRVQAGDVVLTARGSARTLLIAERTALNVCQRLSGVASVAQRYAAAVHGTKAAVFDTRKTTPGWRDLEKYAVVQGGCRNHRHGLFDQVLIKENHIALMDQGSPALAVQRCRERLGADVIIEVEIERLEDLEGVIQAGANIVLLDNMAPEQLRQAVAQRGQRDVQLEASGGITLETLPEIAATGVERISVGALTHSVKALDLSMLCS